MWLKLKREDGVELHVNMHHILQIVDWPLETRTGSALVSNMSGPNGQPYSIVVQQSPSRILSMLNPSKEVSES